MAAKRANRARVLEAMPGTRAQIRERTGLGVATVSRWCEDLRARGEAHVGGWWVHPTGGPAAEVFHPGRGTTPKRPKLSTDRQRVRAYRRRMRASGDWEDVKARRRAEYHARKPVRRDPLVAAFFGAS